jgi:hypothetical protein
VTQPSDTPYPDPLTYPPAIGSGWVIAVQVHQELVAAKRVAPGGNRPSADHTHPKRR